MYGRQLSTLAYVKGFLYIMKKALDYMQALGCAKKAPRRAGPQTVVAFPHCRVVNAAMRRYSHILMKMLARGILG
jgi:hypothetical protein